MGTDIHMVLQTRNDSGSWRLQKRPIGLDKWRDEWDEKEQDGGSFYRWYSSRNYDLFAILADVRNGSGFAGVDTGDGFKPISMPRGFPDDFNLDGEYNDQFHGVWMGDHDFSWLMVKELVDYPWADLSTKRRGVVSIDEYKEWKKQGMGWPKSFCGGVFGPNIITVDIAAMEDYVSGKLPLPLGYKVYTTIDWKTTYQECCKEFVDKWIPEMEKFGANKTRIVFGFDS